MKLLQTQKFVLVVPIFFQILLYYCNIRLFHISGIFLKEWTVLVQLGL